MSKFKNPRVTESGKLKAKHIKAGDFIAFVGRVSDVDRINNGRLMITIDEPLNNYKLDEDLVLIAHKNHQFRVTRTIIDPK